MRAFRIILLLAAFFSPCVTVHNGISTQKRACHAQAQAGPSAPATSANEQPTSQKSANNAESSPTQPPPEGSPTPATDAIESALASYTGWLVVVGIIQIVVFATQAGFLYSSLGATRKAAEAATESARIAREALEVLERAYIVVQFQYISVGEQQLGREVGRVINISYQLQNLGRTVAFITGLHQQTILAYDKSPLP